MKKLLALMLAAALALALVACGGGGGAGDNNMSSTGNGDTSSNIEPRENSNDNESTIIEFDSPITILDSNNVTITATAKVEEEDKLHFGHIVGYRTTIENKNDKYLYVMIQACNIDGTMLNDNELVFFDPYVIAPNTRADATMMIQLNSPCDHISSIDDLHDLSGTWYIYVSDDNTSWGGDDEIITDKILNILP